MNKLLSRLLQAVYPEGITCNVCNRELTERDDRELEVCAYCLSNFKKCDEKPRTVGETEVFSLYEYESVRELVLRCKDNDKPYLAKTIARLLYAYYKETGMKADVVSFIPTGKKNIKKRGYDHMELIAAEFSKVSGLEVVQGVTRTREDVDQAVVESKSRYKNVRESFACRSLCYENKTVLLLDDVITTGATFSACIRAAQSSFPKKIIGLTLGRA